jgi:uncharacterized protein with PIN domain
MTNENVDEKYSTYQIEYWYCETCGRKYPSTYSKCLHCHKPVRKEAKPKPLKFTMSYVGQ